MSWRPNATFNNSQAYNTLSSMSRIANARLGQGSMYGDNNSKPVSPDICLEYMWTENQNIIGYLFQHLIFHSLVLVSFKLIIICMKSINFNFWRVVQIRKVKS